MKKVNILESLEELDAFEKQSSATTVNESSEEEELNTYVVDIRFVTGFTPIMEEGEVKGCSTSVHFKHKGDIEAAKEAYQKGLAELGLNAESMDFTEEVSETFEPEKSKAKLLSDQA